jgi:type I restriction enzyme S subunit
MKASDLKNSILQLAISGKLVPQDPNDEPASVLFDKIQDERKKLITAGKIKAPKTSKNNKHINPSDTPFKIPESWMWVRFGDIVNYSMGKTPSRNDFESWGNDYYWVSIADMVDGGYISTTKEKISQASFDNVFRGRISPNGTLLMSFKLTIGKVSILDMEAFHNEAIISIFPFIDTNKNTTDFLFKFLPYLTALSNDTKSAIKGNTLNSESINNLLIPLPPFAEQRRIVDRLAIFEPLIVKYGSASEELARLISAV